MSDTGEFHSVSSRPMGLPIEAAAPSAGKFGPKKSWAWNESTTSSLALNLLSN